MVHLIEFERRSLHLKLGHQSLYSYCVSELGYCESSAMRRIAAARCIVKFPDIYPLLESNQVNLSTLSRVSKMLTPENCSVLLERLCGRSLREVEAIVAEYEPKYALPRDRVRTVVVRVPVKVATELDAMLETHSPKYNRNGGKESSTSDEDRRDDDRDGSPAATGRARDLQVATILEHHSVVQFTAREGFMKKVEKARCLVWHQLPGATLEQLFELALDELITRRDPVARQERRLQRQPGASHRDPKGRGRYIGAALRDEVFVRDKLQCTYVGTNGRRCASKTALQVDHIRPVARGGSSTANNLRLLCAYHNRLEARQLMGCALSRGLSQSP